MQKPSGTPDTRARRRAAGMRSLETVVHENDIVTLDTLKARMGVASRSEVIRVLIAKTDPATVTQADAAALLERAS